MSGRGAEGVEKELGWVSVGSRRCFYVFFWFGGFVWVRFGAGGWRGVVVCGSQRGVVRPSVHFV